MKMNSFSYTETGIILGLTSYELKAKLIGLGLVEEKTNAHYMTYLQPIENYVKDGYLESLEYKCQMPRIKKKGLELLKQNL